VFELVIYTLTAAAEPSSPIIDGSSCLWDRSKYHQPLELADRQAAALKSYCAVLESIKIRKNSQPGKGLCCSLSARLKRCWVIRTPGFWVKDLKKLLKILFA